MATRSPKEITQLLIAWGDGDEAALEQLTPLVYQQLHRLAHHYLSHERPGHTLQTSALVNEAYVRLIDWKNVRWHWPRASPSTPARGVTLGTSFHGSTTTPTSCVRRTEPWPTTSEPGNS